LSAARFRLRLAPPPLRLLPGLRGARIWFRLLIYCRQHIVSQYLFRLLVHSVRVVVRAGDDDCYIECGDRNHLITPVARHEERRITLLAGLKGLEPPQVAVFGRLINSGMRRDASVIMADTLHARAGSAGKMPTGEVLLAKSQAFGVPPLSEFAGLAAFGSRIDHPMRRRALVGKLCGLFSHAARYFSEVSYEARSTDS
jgi:hypothetical protein